MNIKDKKSSGLAPRALYSSNQPMTASQDILILNTFSLFLTLNFSEIR